MIQKISTLILFSLFCSVSVFGQTIPLQNQKSIGGSNSDYLGFQKSLTNDNQYWMAGKSDSGIGGNHSEINYGGNDFWLVKLDATFNPVFDKNIGGNLDDEIQSTLVFDNRVILSGTSSSDISGNKTVGNYGNEDIWMICLDTLGAVLWQYEYGGDGYDVFPSTLKYSDSSLLLVCSSNSGISGNKIYSTIGVYDYDTWLLEIALNDGHIIRQKVIGSAYDDYNTKIAQMPSGNIVIMTDSPEGMSGDKTDFGFGFDDIWLIELDANFNTLRNKCFGGADYDHSSDLRVFDNQIYFAASTYSPPSGSIVNPNWAGGSSDSWVVKLDHSWNIVWERSYGGTSSEVNPYIEMMSDKSIYMSCYSSSDSGTGNKTSFHFGDRDIWGVLIDTNGIVIRQDSYGGNLNDAGFLPYSDHFIRIKGDSLLLVANSISGISGNKLVNTHGDYDAWIGLIDLSDILSVEENKTLDWNLDIYPNPSNDYFELKGADLTNSRIEVLDCLGNKQKIDWNENRFILPLAGSGVYFLQITSSDFDTSRTLKLVKR